MRGKIVMATLLVMALAGCSGSDDDPGDDVTGETTSPGPTTSPGGPVPTTTGGGPATTTTQPPPGNGSADAEILVFEANETEGEAPLAVQFDLDARSSDPDATWRLAFGDASEDAAGAVADLPMQATHNYTIGGNFTALFEVMYGDGQMVDATTDVTVTVADAGAEPPETHFEYGPTAGCVGDVTPTCISRELGPTEEPVDGVWQPLDERYWGLAFTSTVDNVRGDSDCWAVDADMNNLADDLNGQAGPCAGTLPEGTAWLFIYSYAEPAPSMTLDFTL